MGENIKPATYNLRLVYLRAFFQWCIEEGYLTVENPLKSFKRKKTQDRIVDISEESLKKLLTIPDRTTFSGLRDYALIILTLDTGIRPNEALSLQIKHFDFKRLLIIITSETAKTREERTLPISPLTAETIRKLIMARHPEWDVNAPVFCSYEGKPLTLTSWNHRLDNYSKKIGVKVRPYDLRHSFALLYLRNGGHAFGLQRTLGHADMQMTKRYVHLTGHDLRELHSKASPLRSLIKNKKRIRKL